MRARTGARTAAWLVAATVVLFQLLLAWWVDRHRDAIPDEVADGLSIIAIGGLLAAVFPMLAAVILNKHPRHAVGLVMLAVGGTLLLDAPVRWYALDGLYVRPGDLPGADWAAWVVEWIWVPQVMTLLVFLPLLFPDGRLPGQRWRILAIAAATWIALATVGYSLTIEDPTDFPDVTMPVVVPAAAPLGALIVLLPVFIGAALSSLRVRWREAVGDEREQLRWVRYILGVGAASWALATVLGGTGVVGWGPVLAALTLGPLFLLPVAITVAIVKYRLYEIDTLINRTLVYGGLTGSVLAAYAIVVLLVASVSSATPEWRSSVLVVVVVTLVAYPVRDRMQRWVNQRMYGDRDDPARAMSRLGRRVADSVTPVELLSTVTETIGTTLRLPYVAVELVGTTSQITASYGRRPSDEPQRLELVHQGNRVGALLVGRRSPTEQFTAADVRLLDDVSRQVAAAAHAVQLAADLQRSRERLVLAREEERRRLRRDLHDGVGSALAGLALQAGRARRAIDDAPDTAIERMAALEAGIRASVVDVRRIVDDLRPPALDDLGLGEALRERADALFDGRSVVSCDISDVALPAAVEVAAYRIGTEALTNSARHSGAASVEVRVQLGEGDRCLLIEVVDDGLGIGGTAEHGVGLGSMRERASELGGTCDIRSDAGTGTTVRAVLPLPRTQEGGHPHG